MSRSTVLEEIRTVREHQDSLLEEAFGDPNTPIDWIAWIMIYAGQAARKSAAPEDQRKNMLKVATLAIAAIESFDYNGQFVLHHSKDRVPAGTPPGDKSHLPQVVYARKSGRKRRALYVDGVLVATASKPSDFAITDFLKALTSAGVLSSATRYIDDSEMDAVGQFPRLLLEMRV